MVYHQTRWVIGLVLVFSLLGVVGTVAAVGAPPSVLKAGATGSFVFDMQLSLYQLGFLAQAPTGVFDSLTVEAVRKYQAKSGLSVDGVVGTKTWESLKAAWNKATKKMHVVTAGDTLWNLARKYGVTVEMLARVNNLSDKDTLKVNQKLVIPVPVSSVTTPAPAVKKTPTQQARAAQARLAPALLPWAQVDRIWVPKVVARVVDVATGRSFRARRLYGHNHVDAEPLTAEDTAIMKEIYGGKWSWDRRAVVVEVAGRRIAASMNGYPHGGDSIPSNNFAGQFCIHFLGSRTHGSNRVDPDHQAAIQRAAKSVNGVVVSHN